MNTLTTAKCPNLSFLSSIMSPKSQMSRHEAYSDTSPGDNYSVSVQYHSYIASLESPLFFCMNILAASPCPSAKHRLVSFEAMTNIPCMH
jgi:hypothetical protein